VHALRGEGRLGEVARDRLRLPAEQVGTYVAGLEVEVEGTGDTLQVDAVAGRERVDGSRDERGAAGEADEGPACVDEPRHLRGDVGPGDRLTVGDRRHREADHEQRVVAQRGGGDRVLIVE